LKKSIPGFFNYGLAEVGLSYPFELCFPVPLIAYGDAILIDIGQAYQWPI
jgi:hypothetical protein